MTAPRQVLPGTIYLITRRCSERRFFLRPSPVTNGIFLYVLAVAAQHYNVQVHVACVLSNRCHLVVTDRDACLPEFEQYLDSLVARATNCSLGRFEGFWAAATGCSASRTVTPKTSSRRPPRAGDPVAAGLVQSGAEWPGIWSAPEQVGAAKMTIPRPKVFLREDGDMPETVEFELTTPPGFGCAAEFRERLSSALRRLEKSIRRERASKGWGFLGRVKVLAQKPSARPASGERRFGLNPRIAAMDKWKRIEAISRLEDFLREYRAAWLVMRSGVTGFLFPPGTYHLRVMHDVPCAEAE